MIPWKFTVQINIIDFWIVLPVSLNSCHYFFGKLTPFPLLNCNLHYWTIQNQIQAKPFPFPVSIFTFFRNDWTPRTKCINDRNWLFETIFRWSTTQSELMNCCLGLVSCFWLVPAKLWQQINEAYAPADSLAVCSWWEQPSFAENTSAWLPLIVTHTLTLSLCPLSEAVSSYNQRCPAHIFFRSGGEER